MQSYLYLIMWYHEVLATKTSVDKVITISVCDEDGKDENDAGEGGAGQGHRGPSGHHVERPSPKVIYKCVISLTK